MNRLRTEALSPALIAFLANSLVILTLWLLEKGWGFCYQTSQKIIYENIELIVPSRRQELIADLEQRIGQKNQFSQHWQYRFPARDRHLASVLSRAIAAELGKDHS